MKIEIEVNIPAGYEATGEYRFPKDGDWYLSQGNKCVALESLGHTDRKALILRKIAPKTIKSRSHAQNDIVMEM